MSVGYFNQKEFFEQHRLRSRMDEISLSPHNASILIVIVNRKSSVCASSNIVQRFDNSTADATGRPIHIHNEANIVYCTAIRTDGTLTITPCREAYLYNRIRAAIMKLSRTLFCARS